jgi:hypothetical protein
MAHPPISLAYLRALTDCTGLFQHAVHSIPNRKLGYTTDDNARALIVAAKHYERTGEDLDLAANYLSFVHHAHDPDHRFQNLMSYERQFLAEDSTQDCFGRAMWGCGCAASSSLPENIRIVARKMFDDGIVWAGDLVSPRAKAYTILGMYERLRGEECTADLKGNINLLADSLLAQLRDSSMPDWPWFERYLTYGNAIIAHGMLVGAAVTGKKKHEEAARKTIQFLTDTMIIDGRMEIIGNDGWYVYGKKRAWYDQQSIDAGYTVHLYARAYQLLGDKEYLDLAELAYSWFFGNNRSGVWTYDPVSKGCYDAITSWGLNLNQGAESCVCFLLAQQAMEEIHADGGV